MSVRPSAARAARWITRDSEIASAVVDEILWETAWLLAARSGKFARRELVWADGDPATVECLCAGFTAPRSSAARAADIEHAVD